MSMTVNQLKQLLAPLDDNLQIWVSKDGLVEEASYVISEYADDLGYIIIEDDFEDGGNRAYAKN